MNTGTLSLWLTASQKKTGLKVVWAELKQFESIRKRKKLVYAVNNTKLVYLKSFKPP